MPEAQILVVEDEYIIAKDIQNTLKKLGYSVPAIASSGEKALKKVAEVQPDLVLMDIVLKGKMDGVQTADKIREEFKIPVVYLTAHADDNTLKRAKITEPYGYLTKPFQERELHSTIQMALYREAMEKRLRESEQWLATTLNSIGEGVVATDEKGLITFINPVAEWLIGCKHDEVLKKPIEEVIKIINEDTGKPVKDLISKVLQRDKIVSLAKNPILIANDGSKIPITNSCAPIIDDNKEIIGIVIVFQDISKRKRAEQELQDSEERYRQLVDNIPEPMVVFSEEKLVFVNPASVWLIGASSPEEFIGKSIYDFIHPDDQDEVRARIHEYETEVQLPGQEPIKLKLVRLDGGVLDVEISATQVKYYGKPAIQILIKDITIGRQVEEGLRESEEKFRNLVERSNDGIVIVQDGKIEYANPRMERITGFTAEEVLEKDIIEYIHPDDVSKVLEIYKKRMAGEEVVTNYELTILHKNGNKIDVEINGGLTIFQGKPADLVYIRDITERKRVENAFRESEEKYERLIETSPDAITITDLNGNIAMVNKQTLEIYGCENEDDLIGKNVFEFISPEDRDRAVANSHRILSSGSLKNIQYKLVRKDGTPYHGEISSALITDSEGNPKGFIELLRDNTERILMAAALHDSEMRYQQMIENIPLGVYRTTPYGQILMANPKLVEMMGYSSFDELAKRNLEEEGFEPEYDRAEFKGQIDHDGHVKGLESIWKRQDGSSLYIRENAIAIKDDDGKVLYYDGVVEDITEYKRAVEILHESESRYRSLFEKSPTSITLVDKMGVILDCNSATEKLIGYNKAEIVGKQFETLLTLAPEDLPRLREKYQTILQGQETEAYELEIIKKDGNKAWINVVNSVLVKDTEIIGFQIIAMDITEQKKGE